MTHPTRTALCEGWGESERSLQKRQCNMSHVCMHWKKLRLFHCYSALDFCAILLWDEFSHEILSFAVLQMWHHQCHNNPSPRHYGNCRKIAMHPRALTAIAKRLAREKMSKHAASNLWAHDGKRYSNTLRRSNTCERLDRREVSKAQVSMWMHWIITPPCRMTTCSARMTFSSCRRMSGFSVASGPLTFALYQEAAVYADIKWQCRTILRLHCLFACMSEQLHCLLVRQAQQSSERSAAMNGVASWVAFPPWVSTKKERRYEGMSSSVCFGKFMHPSSSRQKMDTPVNFAPSSKDILKSDQASMVPGQIIATSHDLTPNGGLVRDIPLFQGNLGWWNIIIWPDGTEWLLLLRIWPNHYSQLPGSWVSHLTCRGGWWSWGERAQGVPLCPGSITLVGFGLCRASWDACLIHCILNSEDDWLSAILRILVLQEQLPQAILQRLKLGNFANWRSFE